MPSDDLHISNRELLMAVDAELPADRMAEVEAHVAGCAQCRGRMLALQASSADFDAAYRKRAEGSLPDPAPARASLRRRLAENRDEASHRNWLAQLADGLALQKWVYSAAIVLLAVLGIVTIYHRFWLTNSGGTIARVQAAPLPRPNLTPGTAQNIPRDICLATPKEDPSSIPVSERQEVFREYGMDYRRAGDYELDHLITPSLGGTNDIHNLWPEPYASTEWNAHVKDQLEELLHQMVCSGKVDLPTAQHDIATNWIEAYKRYFHTDKPLHSYSASRKAGDEGFSFRSVTFYTLLINY